MKQKCLPFRSEIASVKTMESTKNKTAKQLCNCLWYGVCLSALGCLLLFPGIQSLPEDPRHFVRLTTLKHELQHCKISPFDNNTKGRAYCSNINISEVVPQLWKRVTWLEIFRGSVKFEQDKCIFGHLTQLSYLKIVGIHMMNIPANFFCGLSKLRTLRLKGNFIKALPPSIFDATPLLENFYLVENIIIKLQNVTRALSKLKHLKILDFSGSLTLHSLHRGDFLPLINSSVEQIDFHLCRIETVENDTLTPLTKLKILNLSDNPLNETMLFNLLNGVSKASIREIMLRHLTDILLFPKEGLRPLEGSSIESLDFEQSLFKEIPKYAFPKLPSLKKLSFDRSDLLMFYASSFHNLPQLEELNLVGTQIPGIGSEFRNLKTLKILDISKAKSSVHDQFKIEPDSLSNLVSLEVLRLRQVHYSDKIYKHTFANLGNLKRLVFSHSNVRGIEDDAFQSLTNLDFLDVGNNKIGVLTNRTFFGLKSITVLVLDYNSLTISNRSLPFQYTPKVELITVTNNKITSLPEGLFQDLTHLETVDLTNNLIAPWNVSIFRGANNLTTLYLKNNEISGVSQFMLEEFKRIQILDLSYNPLNCATCGMADFQKWLNTTSSTVRGLDDPAAYLCHEPPYLKNQNILNVEIPTKHCHEKSKEDTLGKVLIGTFSILGGSVILLAYPVYYFRWYLRYWWFLLKAKVRTFNELDDRITYEYDAFVSYNEEDRDWVAGRLVPELENDQTGIKLCLHDRDFEVGRSISDNILECIEKSRKTVLVLTESYVKSHWCMLEMNMAQHKLFEDERNALVIVLLKAINPKMVNHHLKYVMKTRMCISWTSNPMGQRLFWEKLRKIISNKPTHQSN